MHRGDKIKTKKCWTDDLIDQKPVLYIIESIEDGQASIIGAHGFGCRISVENLSQSFEKSR